MMNKETLNHFSFSSSLVFEEPDLLIDRIALAATLTGFFRRRATLRIVHGGRGRVYRSADR